MRVKLVLLAAALWAQTTEEAEIIKNFDLFYNMELIEVVEVLEDESTFNESGENPKDSNESNENAQGK